MGRVTLLLINVLTGQRGQVAEIEVLSKPKSCSEHHPVHLSGDSGMLVCICWCTRPRVAIVLCNCQHGFFAMVRGTIIDNELPGMPIGEQKSYPRGIVLHMIKSEPPHFGQSPRRINTQRRGLSIASRDQVRCGIKLLYRSCQSTLRRWVAISASNSQETNHGLVYSQPMLFSPFLATLANLCHKAT